ncbi:MAG: PIG-L family deacetylase [Verrucomicrobiales bacterium]|nr:PIG-L family deacetylase [Verrucomicrobiales bacterium]
MQFPRIVVAMAVTLLATRLIPARSESAAGTGPLKTDILGVFAHPDDETGAAGTLAAYALGRGAVVANVYCTRGEGGGNMVGTQGGAALGILREVELRNCLETLGIHRCFFLGETDFAYTESLAITLEKWGHEEALGNLVRIVRALRPEIILTMNPAPNPGQHGNHQAAGILAIEAFDAAADPARFPDQLQREGLSVWRPRKLYYGGPAGTGATVDLSIPLGNGRTLGDVAGEALAHHQSQGFGGFSGSPWLRRPQNWTLVQSVVPFATDETNLFRGLPVAGDTPPRQPSPKAAPASASPGIHFVPRPAVDWFQRWAREQDIDGIASQFSPDVPVIAGEPNVLSFTLDQAPSANRDGEVRFTVPDGWRVDPSVLTLRPGHPAAKPWTVKVTPPADALSDAEISATGATGERKLLGTARMHPVPKLRIPRLRKPLRVADGEDVPGWSLLPIHAILPSQSWQGTVTNAEDCSGLFRLGHDGSHLFVEVRVRDDRVVSNIQPNDIRGHWRSDSVELCFDPSAGSEHTLGAFKLGVFPFDASGRVRAARDADARPGLVEETSPKSQLASWKTPDGYAIRASIPLSDLGPAQRTAGRRIGLNILIYDGDKADAGPGENINRSRLAWAPRAGIQGRPEDWGRADFE